MSFSAVLSCAFVLLGVTTLANPASALARQLQRAHPLFGKCTTSDLRDDAKAGGVSFLQEKATPSDDECMQLLDEDDTFFFTGFSSEDDDNAKAESRITESSSPEEIITHAKELLNHQSLGDSPHAKALMKGVWSLLKRAANESTVFVIGLGIELFAFSKISKNVIAVETDDGFCRSFLKSKAGACAMQANVHIYCTRPISDQKQRDSGASMLETTDAAGGASLVQDKDMASVAQEPEISSEEKKFMEASKILLDDLVKQQFGDVPLSALVVLGRYPVAKLLLMQEFVDQSTVILSRSRMSVQGLAALSGVMRVMINFETVKGSNTHSTESILLLQRLFSLAKKGDEKLWMKYTTRQWALDDNNAPLQLVDTVRQEVLSFASSKGVSQQKQRALNTYLDVYAQATRTGTDKQWQDIAASLKSLQASAGKGHNFDDALAIARGFAVKAAEAAAARTGLQEYVKLIMSALKNQKEQEEPLVHSAACELILDAAYLIASPGILEKVKDGIEDACELAQLNSQLFLPAIRLIHQGLIADDIMGEVVQILAGLKKLGPSLDVSSLSTPTSYLEA